MPSPISRSSVLCVKFLESAPRRALPQIFVCLLIGIAFGGCQAAERGASTASETSEGEALFGGSGASSDTAAREAWTIVVYGYRGENRAAAARAALDKIAGVAGMTGFRPEQRGETTVIAYGRYDDPNSQRAVRDVERIQRTEVDGAFPFRGAVLTPPAYAGLGSHPEYDLRRVRERFPRAVSSLQIGFYTALGQHVSELPADAQREIREAGEQAAVNLRREGELAFYYHGPTGTAVTVGVFTDEDIDAARQYESPLVQELKARFPHNLVNGKELRQRIGADQAGNPVWTTASSRPIAIP